MFFSRRYGGMFGGGGFYDDYGVNRSGWAEKSNAALRREAEAKRLFTEWLAACADQPESAFPVSADVVPATTHLTAACWKTFKQLATAKGCKVKRREATAGERGSDKRRGKMYVIVCTCPVHPGKALAAAAEAKAKAAAAKAKREAAAAAKAARAAAAAKAKRESDAAFQAEADAEYAQEFNRLAGAAAASSGKKRKREELKVPPEFVERAAQKAMTIKKAGIAHSFMQEKRQLLQELAQRQRAAEKRALEDMQRAKAAVLERVVA